MSGGRKMNRNLLERREELCDHNHRKIIAFRHADLRVGFMMMNVPGEPKNLEGQAFLALWEAHTRNRMFKS